MHTWLDVEGAVFCERYSEISGPNCPPAWMTSDARAPDPRSGFSS